MGRVGNYLTLQSPPGERGRLPNVTLLPPGKRGRLALMLHCYHQGREGDSPWCYIVTTRGERETCPNVTLLPDYTWRYTVSTRGEREIIPNVTPKVTPSPPEKRGRLHLTITLSLPEWFCSKMGYTWHHLHFILSKETAVDKVTRQSAECCQHWQMAQYHTLHTSCRHQNSRHPC